MYVEVRGDFEGCEAINDGSGKRQSFKLVMDTGELMRFQVIYEL
jgi:hypothetical protein